MQLPLHDASPEGQVHVPPTHVEPPPQVFPQAPQLASSSVVSTHAPPQFVLAPASAHDSAQLPPAQTSPAAHAAPQAPQFAGFDARSTHCPAQSMGCAPPEHAHAPPWHV